MQTKIALGFGNNIDYEIVWDSGVFEALITQYGIRQKELDINRLITSERDLVISILSFLKVGSGGERFVASTDIIETLSQKFVRKITLGGTSVRAAIAMRKFGHRSALHLVTLNDHVRRLIPQDSPYVCSSTQDSSHPHLIVQFDKSTCVKAGDIDICARQANRLIYHSDTDNITMKLNEDFGDLITKARVLLVSGFNAMQDESLLVNRLETLLSIMQKLPQDALVFYEDAGYYAPEFSHIVRRTLGEKLSVFSLNEDELQGYLNTELDLLNAAQIEVALAELHNLISAPTIVVHSRHWALAYGTHAQRFAAALKAGVTMATTRYCYGDDFSVADYQMVAELPPHQDIAKVAAELNRTADDRLCCVPVAHVEPEIATTIGLGDAFVGGFLPAL